MIVLKVLSMSQISYWQYPFPSLIFPYKFFFCSHCMLIHKRSSFPICTKNTLQFNLNWIQRKKKQENVMHQLMLHEWRTLSFKCLRLKWLVNYGNCMPAGAINDTMKYDRYIRIYFNRKKNQFMSIDVQLIMASVISTRHWKCFMIFVNRLFFARFYIKFNSMFKYQIFKRTVFFSFIIFQYAFHSKFLSIIKGNKMNARKLIHTTACLLTESLFPLSAFEQKLFSQIDFNWVGAD